MIPTDSILLSRFQATAKAALERAAYAGEPTDVIASIYHALQLLTDGYNLHDYRGAAGDRVCTYPLNETLSVYERDPFTPILRDLLSVRHPEAWYRVQMIIRLLNLLVERGATRIPGRILLALWEVSERDPDPLVQAWALFAMNPRNKPVPEIPDLPDDFGKGAE